LKNPRFVTTLARINLLVIAFLVVDTFLLSPLIVKETFTESRGGRRSFLVDAESGTRYKVPEEVYIELSHEREEFLAYQSRLFKRGILISYTLDGVEKKVKTGFLNHPFGFVLACIVVMFSLLNVAPRPLITYYVFSTAGVIFSSFMAVLIILFYFCRQHFYFTGQ
jgi:hypothetical protein